MVFGYAIYSLNYGKHRGWYSWVISSMVGFVYMFGGSLPAHGLWWWCCVCWVRVVVVAVVCVCVCVFVCVCV